MKECLSQNVSSISNRSFQAPVETTYHSHILVTESDDKLHEPEKLCGSGFFMESGQRQSREQPLSSAAPLAWNSEKCSLGEAEKDRAGSHHTYREYQEAQERESHCQGVWALGVLAGAPRSAWDPGSEPTSHGRPQVLQGGTLDRHQDASQEDDQQ